MLSFQGIQDMFGMMKGIDDLEFLETLGPLKEG
jgi:hypothetical protein